MNDIDAFYKRYAGGHGINWDADLLASIKNPNLNDLNWPTLPPASVQQGLQGSDGAIAIGEALAFRRYVNRTLGQHNHTFCQESRLLDFGSGWGRIARAFMADLPASRIYGLEPFEHVLTSRMHNHFINFIRIDPLPPLPLRSNFATHLVCFSVFTHFNWEFFDAWIREIHRVMQPGGMVFLTTLGMRFLEMLRRNMERKQRGEKLHFWTELLLDRVDDQRLTEIGNRITAGEYYFLPSSRVARAEFAECFVTDRFFQKQYEGLFDVVAYSKDGELAQDCVALRKTKQ